MISLLRQSKVLHLAILEVLDIECRRVLHQEKRIAMLRARGGAKRRGT